MRHRILSLGAGVQSTTLYLMAMEGEIPAFDLCIFADTQAEPKAVMDHLAWLQSLDGPRIVVTTAGSLTDNLELGPDDDGKPQERTGRFITIPAYTNNSLEGKQGIMPRQCTREFKLRPIQHAIKEHVFGIPSRKHIPKDAHVQSVIGLSYDEPKRVIRVKQRYAGLGSRWSVDFPLWDLEMTRGDCLKYLEGRVPHQTPRSACVYCPFHSNDSWRNMRDNHPEDWAKACEIDRRYRHGRGLEHTRYLHQSRQPLELVNLDMPTGKPKGSSDFIDECEGMCGH